MQAGLCLACTTEPHVRTCVWMCEVTCTHVGCSKMSMGGDARWKREGVATMWVGTHKHAVSRGDVTASQISLLVSTCISSVYITFHFSVFSVCFFPCFFLSFFLTRSFLLLLLTSCPSSFTLLFLYLFFFHVLFLSSSAYLLYSHIPYIFPRFSYIFFLPSFLYSFVFTFPFLSLTTTHRHFANNLIAQLIVPSLAVRCTKQQLNYRHVASQIQIMNLPRIVISV